MLLTTAVAESHNLPAITCFHIQIFNVPKILSSIYWFHGCVAELILMGGMGNTDFFFLLNILPFAARWLGVCVCICAATVHLMISEWREMLIVVMLKITIAWNLTGFCCTWQFVYCSCSSRFLSRERPISPHAHSNTKLSTVHFSYASFNFSMLCSNCHIISVIFYVSAVLLVFLLYSVSVFIIR